MTIEMRVRNYLKRIGRLLGNNRGTWMATATAISAASLGLSAYQTFSGGGDDFNPEDMLVYKQLPDYTESTGAREDWWSKLQEWGKDTNYGAISPAWNEAWDLAKKKINQYYWGGVGDTGLAGKVKASAARRNASQSPALQNQLAMMGMSEVGNISDLTKEEAVNKATFRESARQNWRTSLQNLAGLKPSFVTGTGAVGGSTSYNNVSALSDMLSGAGGIATDLAKNKQIENLLTKLLRGEGSSNISPSSLSSNLGLTPQLGSTGMSGFDFNFPEIGSYN